MFFTLMSLMNEMQTRFGFQDQSDNAFELSRELCVLDPALSVQSAATPGTMQLNVFVFCFDRLVTS